jgi:hypothetical protein
MIFGCELVVIHVINKSFVLLGMENNLAIVNRTIFASAELTPTGLPPQLYYQYFL